MSTESDAYGLTPPPVEINAIVPGNIFQDDVPPSTFVDGNEPITSSPPPPTTNEPTTSSTIGGGGGARAPDIEVNPTIQTVLISLGICVGALFLLGVIATHYITHKNKRAEQKKKRLSAESELTLGGGSVGSGEKSGGDGSGGEKSDMVTVMIDDYEPTTKKKNGSSPKTLGRSISSSSSSSSTNSPKNSIIGGIGTAVGTNAASRGLGDTRNSFMEVAQVYTRRQSITPTPLPHQSTMTLSGSHSTSSLGTSSLIRSAGPGYSQQHGSELQIGVYPYHQQQLQQQFSPFLQDQNSPYFPISPSSAGTTDENRNPFASPPLSAGLQDPFRTQNNSEVDLATFSASGGTSSNPTSKGPSPSTSSSSLSSSAAGSGPSGTMDRRAIVNSTSSPSMAHISNKFSSGVSAAAYQGPAQGGHATPTNEGNAWYRKRTSVTIPDATSAHIRLWRDDGEETSNSPLTKSPPRLQRPFRSGSQSSVKGPTGSTVSPPSSSPSPPAVAGSPNPATVPSPLQNASRWSPTKVLAEDKHEGETRDHGKLEPRVSRNGAAVFEGRVNKISTSLSRSRSPAGREIESASSPRTPTTPRVPLLIEPEKSNDIDDGGEPSEEVIVRLRANRRGSHSSHRQSYLDDIQ